MRITNEPQMYRPILSLLAAAAFTALATAQPMTSAAPQPPPGSELPMHIRDTLSSDEQMSTADSLLIIDWRPPMLDMERIEYTTAYERGDSTSSVVIRVVMPRHALDRSTVTIWRTIINNGSMGNWNMPYPAGYLDARTLSFSLP